MLGASICFFLVMAFCFAVIVAKADWGHRLAASHEENARPASGERR